jgi:hypothetical protein
MTQNSAISAQEEAYYRQKREEFNLWKNSEISKKIIKYLKECSDDLTTSLLSLASTNIPSDIKLSNYHFISAKIQLIQELLNLDVDVFAQFKEEDNQ